MNVWKCRFDCKNDKRTNACINMGELAFECVCVYSHILVDRENGILSA